MAEHEITLTTIYDILQDSTRFLQPHTRLFQDHTRRLERLDSIESVQNQMAIRLINVETILKEHSSILRTMQLRVDSLHGLVEELERRTGRPCWNAQEYRMITEALRRLE